MEEKRFKTYDEMLTILARKGVELATPQQKSEAKRRLQHEGYYNLINGYKDLFLLPKANPSDEDRFKPGTTVSEIYSLYTFDKKLREIFFRNILIIETNMKSLISYAFAEQYGHKNYLIYSNFDMSKKDAPQQIAELISTMQRQISGHSKDPNISHYLNHHGYVPLWVLNNIITFGTLSKFYSLMKQHDRQAVSRVFHISDQQLESYLFLISILRNFCAHSNRIYCFKSKSSIDDNGFHAAMSIPVDTSGRYIYGKNDLFAAAIVLKTLLPKHVFKIFIKQISHAISSLGPQRRVLTEDEVLSQMGFPSDWRTKLLI